MAWVSPTGYYDYGSNPIDWDNETRIYDNNTSTTGYSTAYARSWGPFVDLTRPSISCSKLRFWAYGPTASHQIDIDVYYNGAWHNVYQGTFAYSTWIEKSLEGTYDVTKARVKFYNNHNNPASTYLYEFMFWSLVPPIANFSVDDNNGVLPYAVQFTDTSTQTPTSWLWNFGDGETSEDQHPAHTYQNEGVYTVSLEAINEAGSDTETKTEFIRVGGPPYEGSWIKPTSHNDTGGAPIDWEDEIELYDNNIVSSGYSTAYAESWGAFLELLHSEFQCAVFRFYAEPITVGCLMDVDVYYEAAWHHLISRTFLDKEWETVYLGGIFDVTKFRIRVWNSHDDAAITPVYELDFFDAPPVVKGRLSEMWNWG